MTDFAHLHCHSEYSSIDGLSTTKEIAERCQCLGCQAASVSDHGTVAGHLALAKTCEEYGLKPIFAMEGYHGEILGKPKSQDGRPMRDQAHFLVGALNNQGLSNLWRLSSAAATNFHFVPRFHWDMLVRYSDGLFATSACIQGLVSQGIKKGDLSPLDNYLSIFGDNFYIELHTYPGEEQEQINLELVSLAQERGIPVVFASDAHFATRDQYDYHDAYVAMSTGQSIDTPIDERKMWHPPALYMLDEDEIRSALSYLPKPVVEEALINSSEIANKVDAQIPEIRKHLPIFYPSECPWVESKDSASILLLDLVEEGLIQRYGENASEEVWERAQMELKVFFDAGLEHYFLQAWDFVTFCNRHNIRRGPGRGSAAGSIVAYALEITDIDPLRYGLIFERFYNAGREKGGFPDIDNDFPVRYRKVVRDYLKERWGKDKVRVIGTVTRLKPKKVCDVTRGVCGITYAECESVKKIIGTVPDINISGTDTIGWSDKGDGKTIYVMDHVGQEIAEWIARQPKDRQDSLWRWIDFCDALCGRVSGYGVHPSGTVVADCELDSELPCMWSTHQEELVTQFPMADVDKRMFLKQDLLGLRNLDTIEEWENITGEAIEWSGLETKNHPEGMWRLLDQGLTQGIFQIEDGEGRTFCQKLKPRTIEDLALIVTMIRPGPKRSGAQEIISACRSGLQEPQYDHPILEPILGDTYGVFLYQEGIINYFTALGYSLSDADAVRKILGKKLDNAMRDLRDGLGEWRGKSYFDMASKHMDRKTAELIWDKIQGFSKYSFNWSHAVAYGILAFRTLYIKWKNPAAFYMACIKTNPDAAARYVAEARKMDVKILPPHIQYSASEISSVEDRIYFGFENVKGITRKSGEFLEALRENYGCRTPHEVTAALENMNEKWSANGKKGRSPKSQFRSNQIIALINAGAFDEFAPRTVTLAERQKLEREYLGILLTDNSQQIFDNNLDLLAECDTYSELENEDYGKYILPGVVSGIKEIVTKAEGKKMGIVRIEYEVDDVEFAVFPKDWQRYGFLWKDRTLGIFEIGRTDRGFVFRKGQKIR